MKNILITGSTSGIGLATAKILSNANNSLYLVGRKFHELEALLKVGEIKQAVCLPADLTKAEDLEALVDNLPALDGMVLAAGITKVLPFSMTCEKDILDINSINYNSNLLLIQKLLKSKKIHPGASLVIISSISATNGMKANSIYAGTKGALIAFSKALALELAPQKIRVNCILPGLVRTPMVEKTVLGEHLAEHEKSYPLKFGRPEDIGYAAEFLLSEKARWITGTSMVVDGGFTAY